MPNRATRRAWPKRRQWLDRLAGEHRLTSGAKSFLLLLARRSDDAGKPVWGNQMKMAAELLCSDRSVRRYLVEAVDLGYVVCYRTTPEQGTDGRWFRRRSNSYYFLLPGRETASRPAPRRRQRAGYCVLVDPFERKPTIGAVRARKSWSGLADSDGRSPPFGGRKPAPSPQDVLHQTDEAQQTTPPVPEPEPSAADRRSWFAAEISRLNAIDPNH